MTGINFLSSLPDGQGYICYLGRQHEIPTPVNDTIVSLIKAAVALDQFRLHST